LTQSNTRFETFITVKKLNAEIAGTLHIIRMACCNENILPRVSEATPCMCSEVLLQTVCSSVCLPVMCRYCVKQLAMNARDLLVTLAQDSLFLSRQKGTDIFGESTLSEALNEKVWKSYALYF